MQRENRRNRGPGRHRKKRKKMNLHYNASNTVVPRLGIEDRRENREPWQRTETTEHERKY